MNTSLIVFGGGLLTIVALSAKKGARASAVDAVSGAGASDQGKTPGTAPDGPDATLPNVDPVTVGSPMPPAPVVSPDIGASPDETVFNHTFAAISIDQVRQDTAGTKDTSLGGDFFDDGLPDGGLVSSPTIAPEAPSGEQDVVFTQPKTLAGSFFNTSNTSSGVMA